MKGFIYSNQSIVYVVGSVLFLILLYFVIKALPTKVKKKEVKVPEKKSEESAKEEIKEPEKTEEVPSEESLEETKKDKKTDKKPKIVQIYKREQRTESGEQKQKSHDPIYDRNVEFINTSKNIAKFKSFAEESKQDDEVKDVDEYGFVQDVQEDCEFCEAKTKHFDHSRRLSKAIKEDNFDNLFDSHLSEKYMNINSDRHLKLDEKFHSNLFGRTEEMMSKSFEKLNLKSEEIEESQGSKYSLFSQVSNSSDDFVDEDEVKVNMKTALIAETYFGKRKKK